MSGCRVNATVNVWLFAVVGSLCMLQHLLAFLFILRNAVHKPSIAVLNANTERDEGGYGGSLYA